MNSVATLYRSRAFKLTTWLLLAAIAGGLTMMVWIASAVKPNKALAQKSNDNPLVVDPMTLLVNHNPDETIAMVKPITFDAVIRDMRNYPKEFKDSRFVKANVGKWTVQVMNVVENDVITDYLNSRKADRNQFNYFRIVDEKNQKRFVLTYGIFNSAQEAIAAAQAAKFNLPNNVDTFPEEFKLYMTQMDEYEITPPLQDIGKNAPRDVKLKTTQKPLPAPKAKPVAKTQEKNTTDTTTTVKPKQEKTSIEKSSSQRDTLNVQERRVAPTATEEKPLKIQKTAPPPLTEERAISEKATKEQKSSEQKSKEQKPKEQKPKEPKPKEQKPKESAAKEKPAQSKADSSDTAPAQ